MTSERGSPVGIYALIIYLRARTSKRIGALGRVQFERGTYVYVGSALNSLEGRISRHFRRAKKIHWHIDYLLAVPAVQLLGFGVKSTTQRIECAMSRAILRRAWASIDGFGCSDCDCSSHLYSFGTVDDARQSLSMLGFRLRPRVVARQTV